MATPSLRGPTAYETWVRTLQAWTRDPSTPLDQLPQLDDDTYTPETYARLFEYVTKALAAVTNRWSGGLQAAFAQAQDPHELARALQHLRPVLARRVQLARLSAHPPGIRKILEEDLTATVNRLQAEFEESVRKDAHGARLDRTIQEGLLRVVRENPFTAVLKYSVDERGQLAAPGIHESAPGQRTAAAPSRWNHRLITPNVEPEG